MALNISPEVEASMRAGEERNRAAMYRDTSAYGHGQRASNEELKSRAERSVEEKAREARPAEAPKTREVPADRAATTERPRRELSGQELEEARARADETARMREEGRTKVGGEWLTREQIKEREAQNSRPGPADRPRDDLRERFIAQGVQVPKSRAEYAEQERQRIVAEGRNEKQGLGRIKEDANRAATAERNSVYAQGRADGAAFIRGEGLPKAREEIGRQSTPATERFGLGGRSLPAGQGFDRMMEDNAAQRQATYRSAARAEFERGEAVPLSRSDIQAIERDRGGPRTPPRQIERPQPERERLSMSERVQNVRENVQERVQQIRERAARSFGRE